MTIYAKFFIVLDGNQLLTGAATAQLYPYGHYTCHLCGSVLVFSPLAIQRESLTYGHSRNRATPFVYKPRTRLALRFMQAGLLRPYILRDLL